MIQLSDNIVTVRGRKALGTELVWDVSVHVFQQASSSDSISSQCGGPISHISSEKQYLGDLINVGTKT